MSLSQVLSYLENHELIKNFEFINESKAKIELVNGKGLIVYMAEDYYILTYMGIKEAWNKLPVADYVLYNAWDYSTEVALSGAKRNGVKVLSFSEFKEFLEENLDNQ